MGRTAVLLVVMVSAARIAAAQAPAPPQPSIGLPLPAIGLPLPALGLPPADARTIPLTTPEAPPVPSRPAMVFFGLAPYAWGFEAWQQSTVPGVIAVDPRSANASLDVAEVGYLQLEVQPRDAQIYADGEFVGTWGDVEGRVELTAGTHRIELRAPKHEPLAFEVRIAAGRTITYRGSLVPIEQPATRPPGPAPTQARDPGADAKPAHVRPKQTFYLIPGCYLGNVPPEQVKLPAGCDLRRVITHTPGQ